MGSKSTSQNLCIRYLYYLLNIHETSTVTELPYASMESLISIFGFCTFEIPNRRHSKVRVASCCTVCGGGYKHVTDAVCDVSVTR